MNNYSGELKKHGFEGKIFLCYALGDLPEVQRIVYDLEKELGIWIPLSSDVSKHESVCRAIENSTVFMLFISDALKNADNLKEFITRANNTNKNILPIVINKRRFSSIPSEFKLRVKPYDYNDRGDRMKVISQLRAVLGINVDNGDEFGSLVYVESDMYANIYRNGEKLETLQLGKECKIRLGKGVHKLEFVAVGCSELRSRVSYEVKSDDGVQRLFVSLHEVYVRNEKKKTVRTVREAVFKSFLIFAANLAVALLCFWYCYAKDYEYQELTTTIFGTYNVWRINWLWYIFGIAFIVFVIRTVEKLLDLRAAYKRYCNIK